MQDSYMVEMYILIKIHVTEIWYSVINMFRGPDSSIYKESQKYKTEKKNTYTVPSITLHEKSLLCVTRHFCSHSKLFPHLSQYLLNVLSPMSASNKQKNIKKQWRVVKQRRVLESAELEFQSHLKWCDFKRASPSEKWCKMYLMNLKIKWHSLYNKSNYYHYYCNLELFCREKVTFFWKIHCVS